MEMETPTQATAITEPGGDRSSSEESIDYEGMPILGIGQKRRLTVTTYVELHDFVRELVKILEEVFELGILKGSAKKHRIMENGHSANDGGSSDDLPLD